MKLWVQIRPAWRLCYMKPFPGLLLSLCGREIHYVAEINTDKHTEHLGDMSASAFPKLVYRPHSSSLFLQKLFWLLIEEKEETKSHNWNQMKEDTSEERMSCQRLTSSHYPIREQRCQRPTSSYYPGRGEACQRCPEILWGQGDVNKEQSLDSQSHTQRQIQTGVCPGPF